jgi:hypothetical protein
MAVIQIGAVAAKFGRDLDFDLRRIATLIEHARRLRVSLLVLPDAALGGCLGDLHVRKVAALAAEMVVCFGFCEAEGDRRYNTALCVHGDGVLGSHRKVHQPAGESITYSAGERFSAFDTPVGRIGMLIDYDKTFPESARTLTLDGADVLACLSAWPTSFTNRAPRIAQDRQTRLFDLYDQASGTSTSASPTSTRECVTVSYSSHRHSRVVHNIKNIKAARRTLSAAGCGCPGRARRAARRAPNRSRRGRRAR